jgi:hypothetical protein
MTGGSSVSKLGDEEEKEAGKFIWSAVGVLAFFMMLWATR